MSTSGLFGKIIPLNPFVTIFIRCLIAGLLLLGYLRLRGGLNISWKRDRWFFLISSVLLSIHWVSYFQSVKMAGVALGMLSLFSYPIVTSILEPFFFKSKHSWFDILSSIVVLVGLAMIVPEFSFGNKAVQGVLLGLGSSVLYAVRNILNRRYITTYSGSTIMCYQLLISVVLLFPSVLIFPLDISANTWSNLAILSLVTTAIAHTLFVQGLATFTTSTVSILSCLTPVYGILWAVWLTDEQINEHTIWGGLIILLATFAQSIRHYHKHPHVTGNIR
jgi:drug/metabolite transporter (DMT)-like permease